MKFAEIKDFSMDLFVPFGSAIALIDAKLGDFSTRFCAPESGFGIRPEQIQLRHSDILYGYTWTATFYGGNATITRTAESIRLTLRGGSNRKDALSMTEAFEKFAQLVELPASFQAAVQIAAVAAFQNEGVAREYFEKFRPEEPTREGTWIGGIISVLGELPYARSRSRIVIEPHISYLDGVFVQMNTTVDLDGLNVARMNELIDAARTAVTAHRLDLNLRSE